MSIADDIRTPFKSGNVLIQLILVNVAVFLVLNIIRLGYFFAGYSGGFLEYYYHQEILTNVAMPMTFESFIHKPWTLITYFFSQVGIGHIFWNMIILYFFGTVIYNLLGYSRILAIYVYGGLIGGILTLVLHSTVPVLREQASILIGASGSVMAIVIAAATLAPGQRVMLLLIGEIKLIYIALFYVFVDLVGLTYIDGVGHICHLGGALTGYVFMSSLKSGRDFSKGFNKLFYGFTGLFSRRPKPKAMKKTVLKGNGAYGRVVSTSKSEIQQRIDSILDKISKAGYESLSKEEKDYLFRHGKDV